MTNHMALLKKILQRGVNVLDIVYQLKITLKKDLKKGIFVICTCINKILTIINPFVWGTFNLRPVSHQHNDGTFTTLVHQK